MNKTLLALGAAVLFATVQTATAQTPQKPPTPAPMPNAKRDTRGDRIENLDLMVGQQTVVAAEGVKNWSESEGGIVSVRLDEKAERFFFVAVKAGKSTILFVMRDGRQVRYVITVRSEVVERKDNIRLDFYFVQLSSRSGYRVGVGWPSSISATGQFDFARDLIGKQNDSNLSVSSSVLPRLDIAESRGWAQIHRHATLVTSNGSRGEFGSGGEINFRVENALTTAVKSIEFGSEVKVLPIYDSQNGRLEMIVEADISALTEQGADGLPGRSVTTLKNTVNLELGQSIVLAGLTSADTGKSTEGLPLLSRIPVIGVLFGTKAKRTERVENLIFIVPTVVDAVTPEARSVVNEALSEFGQFDPNADDLRRARHRPRKKGPGSR